MGVYVKGMEMLSIGTYEASIDVTNINGKTVISLFARGEGGLVCCGVYEAVFVPPHGRLIDADVLEHIIGQFSLNWEYGQGVSDCWDALLAAPTVIEAEEGEQ